MHASVVVHLYYYIMYISEVQAHAKHAAMILAIRHGLKHSERKIEGKF